MLNQRKRQIRSAIHNLGSERLFASVIVITLMKNKVSVILTHRTILLEFNRVRLSGRITGGHRLQRIIGVTHNVDHLDQKRIARGNLRGQITSVRLIEFSLEFEILRLCQCNIDILPI